MTSDTIKGHIVSMVMAAILGVLVCLIAYSYQKTLTELEFLYLMFYEAIVVSSGVAWYMVAVKFGPTGISVDTSPDANTTKLQKSTQ